MKKVNKHTLSIVSMLMIAAALIVFVWVWFERQNAELEKKLHEGKEQKQNTIVLSSN